MKKRFNELLELARLLYELQPQQAVHHPWKVILQERLGSRPHAELGDILIRQMTLLHRHDRLEDKGAYQSEEEDLVLALQLLEGEYRNNTLLSPRLRLIYMRLKSRLAPGQVFKRKDVERITGYKKTQSQRILQKLVQCDKIERLGGNAPRGYYYRLVEEVKKR